jgi:hypothetical protein
MTMNALIEITGDSKRLTVCHGGRTGVAIRVEGVSPDLDMWLDLDTDMARNIAGALVTLADECDEDNE